MSYPGAVPPLEEFRITAFGVSTSADECGYIKRPRELFSVFRALNPRLSLRTLPGRTQFVIGSTLKSGSTFLTVLRSRFSAFVGASCDLRFVDGRFVLFGVRLNKSRGFHLKRVLVTASGKPFCGFLIQISSGGPPHCTPSRGIPFRGSDRPSAPLTS